MARRLSLLGDAAYSLIVAVGLPLTKIYVVAGCREVRPCQCTLASFVCDCPCADQSYKAKGVVGKFSSPGAGFLQDFLKQHTLRPGASRWRHLGKQLLCLRKVRNNCTITVTITIPFLHFAVCNASSWPNKGNGPAQPVKGQLKAVARRLVYLWQNSAKSMQIGWVSS